ncbi:MAG: patatin-like phospholipase family protein [Candidatus Saganbacteria bacterium]|nr:patatin-like phospholipase family protein [Candidatus Saganbacteria bacterium]
MRFPWGGRKKIGLALGGGVARGLAHIGVLKVLKKEKIPIDCIAATSSGAVIGSFFAFGLDPEYLEEIAKNKIFDLFKVSLNQINPFAQDEIVQVIERQIGKANFRDADIPIIVVAQDIKSGKRVLLKSGRVSTAVSASCAFPGIFNPKKLKGKTLIDGGGADNLPVSVLDEMGAEIKIAVDVVPQRPLKRDPTNPIQVMGRAVDLVIRQLTVIQRQQADILIEPDISPEIWHTDFHKVKALIKFGEQAALKKISEIKKNI